MFGGRPEVHLVWALGTDLHTDAVLDQKHNLSPTAGGHTGQHTPTSHILVGSANLACSVQPPGGNWGTWFCLEGAGEPPQDIPESLLSSLCCCFKPG